MSKPSNVVRHPNARAWKAAKVQLTASQWPMQSRPVDVEIRFGLKALRARAREAAQNEDHAKAFLRACKTNIIGPRGVSFQSKARLRSGRPDRRSRAAIEEHFALWGEAGSPEVTGKLSWADEQRRAIETVARDGEAFYRLVSGWDGNAYAFALQAIDPEVIDVGHNERLADGRSIVMGIEIDIWRRPIAFHLRPDEPLTQFYPNRVTAKKRIRVPADEIIHLSLPEWVWQTRGIPWLSTSLTRMHQLGQYEEAAIIAARAGASKMGFYEQGEDADTLIGENAGEASGAIGDGETSKGDLIEAFEPGHNSVLPPGYTFKGWDPTFPTADHGPFIKAALRGIASGLGIGYNQLANDYEGVNFSSLRMSALVERDIWMAFQDWLIGAMHVRVQRAWLDASLRMGAITYPNGAPLDITRVDDFKPAGWQGRRWQWVDPKKEVEAATLEVALRVRSISDLIRERGRDPDEVWEELSEDVKRLDELGISAAAVLAATAEPNQEAPDAEDE
ncbi:MAG: phage portal protein [Gammaproteobacteria bacterium]|nr:MAG: phage portal protein [Gammaproteobacteria bacterium]